MKSEIEIISRKNYQWHTLDVDETLRYLATPPDKGLSEKEAKKRMREYGENKLAEAPPTSFLALLWEQFNNFVVILLLVAAIISAALGDWIEATAIMTIVVLNAILGIVQEKRAEQALKALRQLAAPEANILRDGHRITVPAHALVPGDIVFLEAGNYVPADVRLLDAVNLQIDESALTGESVPVQKNADIRLEKDIPLGDRKNTAFMGTLVTYGRGKGVVVNTGMQTQIGLIAEMLQSVDQEQTPLQKKLDELGKVLGWSSLAVCGIVFIVGWMRGTNPLDMFLIAVSLAIAAVPEGLPAVVTISLALGMREMIRHNALIRKLSSVETLGSATVICSDKTGTLTQNEMTVTEIAVDGDTVTVTGTGYNPVGQFLKDGKPVNLAKEHPSILTALWVGALNNDASLEVSGTANGEKTYRMIGDPTEGALIVAAAKAGASASPLNKAYPRIQEIPFDSEKKRMITVHIVQDPKPEDISPFYDENKREWYIVAEKGAPDIVLQHCTFYQDKHDNAVPLTDEIRRKIIATNDDMTKRSLRVLGVAYRVAQVIDDNQNGKLEQEELEHQLIFAGLVGMIDPARPEVLPALKKAKNAGIRTVMITGDFPNTAKSIAEEIHLLQKNHHVLTGKELDTLSDEDLKKHVKTTDVFARVSPKHKVRIVQALRANGEVVAMTGDGVNDAPSIKQADIGVAMGITGTDVAKETADMVLTDDNYASIVAAVEQGRVIYSNIRKFVYYLLSCNLAEIATIFLATLFGLPSPLTAIQLLWLNLVTDGAPALALGVEKGDPDIMERPPRPSEEPIINKAMRAGIIIQTIAITTVTLAAYLIGLKIFKNQEIAETMAFVTLSFSELLRAFTARSENYPILRIGIFSNKSMNWAILSSVVLLLAVVYIPFLGPIFNTFPLGLAQWQYVFPLLFIPAIAAEITKMLTRRRNAAPEHTADNP